MNIRTIPMSYDINRKTPVDMITVTHVNDVSARILELELTQSGEKMPVGSGCEVLASIVERGTKLLVKGEIEGSVNENGNVLVPVDTLSLRSRHDLNLEVRITDPDTEQTLTLPYPIWLRVNPSVLDDAEVTPQSEGTVPELLAEARRAIDDKRYILTEEDRREIAELAGLSDKANASDVYDKAEIDSKLLELGGANVVNSVAEMVDTARLYVLAETGHIWRYGTISVDPPNEMEVVSYNRRISGSSGISGVAYNGAFICQKIPVDLTVDSCIVTMKNFAASMGTMGSGNNYENSKIDALDENENVLADLYISRVTGPQGWACPVTGDDCVGDAVAFAEQLISRGSISNKSQIKYLVISPQISSSSINASSVANLGIYISTHGSTAGAWTDTGIEYGGGNEETLTSLDTRLTAAEGNISELAEGSAGVIISSFWNSEVEDTIEKIQALQDESGSDLLCFGWCSDMHLPVNGTDYEKNIGTVAARVMKECNIPLFLMTGDMFTADTGVTLAQIPNAYAKAWEYLSPIGADKILAVKGNHDAWTGSDGGGNNYIKGLPPEKLYRQLFAPQAMDIRRVFGNDGSYYYVDDLPLKTRFICLNSQWAAYEENADGTAKYTTQKGVGFGQEQLEWLTDIALDVPENYSVILALHVPPTDSLADGRHYASGENARDMSVLRGIITAYCDKTTYSGSYTHTTRGAYLQEDTWADVAVSCDFSGYEGELLGIFCGHSHYDQFTVSDLPAPIVCVTSAINTPYDTDWSVRRQGTSDETVIDFVCVNRKTRKIDLIRCGYGNDRIIDP